MEMFAGDWFIRNAINIGLPLSTVASTDNFIKHDKTIYGSSVLLSAVPEADSEYESAIINYAGNGGKVIFYEQSNKGGYNGLYDKFVKNNVIMIHRNNGAFIFSTFSNNTTSEVKLKFPYGAPVLDGYDTIIENGCSNYRFPKSERKECRVFVEQDSGVVSCKELPPASAIYRRRFFVEGLKNATVRIKGEDYCTDNFSVLLNSNKDFHTISQPFDGGFVKIGNDVFFEARNVTGRLTVSMPYTEFPPKVD